MKLVNDMKLVDFYALLQLFKPKKQNGKSWVSKQLYEYIQNAYAVNPIVQKIIKKMCS